MIQNGIIINGVVYELTRNYPDEHFFLCRNCQLQEKCRELIDETLCDIFGVGESREVFRKVKIKRDV